MTEYIKREDAIEAFYTATGDGDKADWAVGVIKSIPSADVVERKHGKWVDPADLICYKCTACGNYANQGYHLDEPIFWDYCPNCGADMRGRKDG